MEKTNQILIISSFNNYNLDIKKQIQYFPYKKLGHGINHCKIKITKLNTNAMQFKITIKNNKLYVVIMIVEKGTENMWHLGTRTTLSYVT
jgi:hypothetical protein